MADIEKHRSVVQQALEQHDLGWDAWPAVVIDPRLTAEQRLSAALVLLATQAGDAPDPDAPIAMVMSDHDPDAYDFLGRARQPWLQLSRTRLPWTAPSATTAVHLVTANRYDERRIALALRGAKLVCADGQADADLLDALQSCLSRLERAADESFDVKPLRALTRRIIASATPPQLLDLSLLRDLDAWAGPAKEAARSLPADEVAPLVRLLTDLGSGKPSRRWLDAVEQALESPEARDLLRSWLELAAHTDIVPEWPGSELAYVPGTLFNATNADVVRAAAWATAVLREDEWPVELLGILARRGAAHNGLAGFPEALALKVAGASVDALIVRGNGADRRELVALQEDLVRRDLRKKIDAALG